LRPGQDFVFLVLEADLDHGVGDCVTY